MFKTADCNVMYKPIKMKRYVIKTCVLKCKCDFFLVDNQGSIGWRMLVRWSRKTSLEVDSPLFDMLFHPFSPVFTYV